MSQELKFSTNVETSDNDNRGKIMYLLKICYEGKKTADF